MLGFLQNQYTLLTVKSSLPAFETVFEICWFWFWLGSEEVSAADVRGSVMTASAFVVGGNGQFMPLKRHHLIVTGH